MRTNRRRIPQTTVQTILRCGGECCDHPEQKLSKNFEDLMEIWTNMMTQCVLFFSDDSFFDISVWAGHRRKVSAVSLCSTFHESGHLRVTCSDNGSWKGCERPPLCSRGQMNGLCWTERPIWSSQPWCMRLRNKTPKQARNLERGTERKENLTWMERKLSHL